MDFLFMACNAICLGMGILLGFWQKYHQTKGLQLWHFLAAIAAGYVFYWFDVGVISQHSYLFYVVNTAIPILLLLLLLRIFWPHPGQES